jgi:hypothetical protein
MLELTGNSEALTLNRFQKLKIKQYRHSQNFLWLTRRKIKKYVLNPTLSKLVNWRI